MKLVYNWRSILRRSHSMWAFYLSLAALLMNDAIYVFWGIDTSPRFWWLVGVGLLIYGIVGRVKDQGISGD